MESRCENYSSTGAKTDGISEDYTFQKSSSFKHSSNVHNVVPGDFTHSGKLDLLIMSAGQSSGSLGLSVYPALTSGGFGACLTT